MQQTFSKNIDTILISVNVINISNAIINYTHYLRHLPKPTEFLIMTFLSKLKNLESQ